MACFKGSFYSQNLQIHTPVQIILPETGADVVPEEKENRKLLYLFHGLSGNEEEWTRFTKLEYYARRYNFAVVLPQVQRSFYCDTAFGPKYFSYVTEELPKLCHEWFRLPQERDKTFVAGESMGGYGAIKAALRCPKQYEAAATLSGVLDFSSMVQYLKNSDLENSVWSWPHEAQAILGIDLKVPDEDDLLLLAKKQAGNLNHPRILQVCGTEDFLYSMNQKFHLTLQQMGYNHTYLEWNGAHEWSFWDTAIQRAMQFFCKMDLKNSPIY